MSCVVLHVFPELGRRSRASSRATLTSCIYLFVKLFLERATARARAIALGFKHEAKIVRELAVKILMILSVTLVSTLYGANIFLHICPGWRWYGLVVIYLKPEIGLLFAVSIIAAAFALAVP